jgi:hypothetical protein
MRIIFCHKNYIPTEKKITPQSPIISQGQCNLGVYFLHLEQS